MTDIVRVRAWDLVVRATHWAIALSIAVLSVTGIEIGHPMLVSPGAAGQRFVMGTVRVVHFYTAIVFTLAVLSRIVWMFVDRGTASYRQFIPLDPHRRKDLVGTLWFYLFLRRTPPQGLGHNALAGAAYVFVFWLYLVMIATGLGLYAIDAVHSPVRWATVFLPLFGGAPGARWTHHVVMWLLLGFFVHHFYSSLLMTVVERDGTLDSIFSGSKWVPREVAERDGAPK